MAGCATRTSFAGHPGHSAAGDHAPTFNLDHPTGGRPMFFIDKAGPKSPSLQLERCKSAKIADLICIYDDVIWGNLSRA
jgi:hypothetical protein